MIMDETPWNKNNWKIVVKRAISEFQENNWREEISSLSSLNMINPGAISFGKPHPAWETAGYSCQNVKMSISKVRFLTDTLMTGEILHKMYGTNPSCSCGFPSENRFHILLDCNIYDDLRNFCLVAIISLINKSHPNISAEMIKSRIVLAHLILDPTWYRTDIGSSSKIMPNILNVNEANKLEIIGRTFCFQVYKKRFNILSTRQSLSEPSARVHS